MSYTRSAAQAGKSLVLSINTGTASTPTWTLVGESFECKPAMKYETEDVTNFQSTGREFIATIMDGGEWKFSANRVSTDAGQAAMQTAFAGGTLSQFQVTAPKNSSQTTTGDVWAFYAYVVEFNPAFEPTKKVQMSGSLRTTNGVTYTEGS